MRTTTTTITDTTPRTTGIERMLAGIIGALVLAIGLVAAASPPASAGQVGVTVGIGGAGTVTVVEGSLEDGAGGTCSQLDNQDQRVVAWCPRFRNSEVLEAWVWLRATPAATPRGHWVFDRWEGCDRTRERDGFVECAVHSGAFSSDERQPVARFHDKVRPEVYGPIASPVADKDGTFRFVFTATDGVTECRVVERTEWVPCSTGHQVTLPEGVYSFGVRATDPSGNNGTAFAHVVAVDTRITQGPPAETNVSAPTVAFASQTADEFWCSLDGSAWSRCGTGPSTTVRLNVLPDGAHRLLVQGRKDGWVDPLPAEWRWTTDTVAPRTTIVVSPRGSEAGVELVNPDAVGFECRLAHPSDPGIWMPCSAEFTYVGLVNGPYTMSVRSRDAAGNVEDPPAVQRWTVTLPSTDPDPGTDPTPVPDPVVPAPRDTTAPDTAVTAGPSGIVLDRSARFALRATEAGSTLRCTLDGTPVACGTDLLMSGLASGTHVLTATAVDAAGNADPSPATRTWTVPAAARELKARGWRLRTARASYDGARLEASRRGTTLARRVSGATGVALVVGKGPRHGTVKVYAGSRLVGTVRLASRRSAHRVVVPVTSFATPFTGRLRVVVASQGRTVRLEGLGVVTR